MKALSAARGRWSPTEGQRATERSTVGPLRNAEACFLCARPRRRICCEDGERVARFLEEREPTRAFSRLPRRMAVCKDCCIGALEGLRWDESMEQVARQALKIRSNFFDNTKLLEDCIPQVLLVRGDYLQDETAPRSVFVN